MRLIPASGSPRIQKALAHKYVHTIASILLQNDRILPPVSFLLRKHDRHAPDSLSRDLESFRVSQSIVTSAGTVAPPAIILEFIQTLYALYQQPDDDIRYQRGAILELLVCKLVSPRYRPGECLGNQRFMDKRGRPITDQVDVAALSHSLRQLEGYECKLKVDGIESADCTNLAYLASAAEGDDYLSNVGIVSFDNQMYMKRKLQRLQPASCIKIYGLDDIATLAHTPF